MMIPVKPAPEPKDFDKKVRRPGRRYLSKLGPLSLNQINWNSVRYWKYCSEDLYQSYKQICCYVGIRINQGEKGLERSVEHFIPKSSNPFMAYEWTNYRLACRKANSARGNKTVMDPFLVGPDDFRLLLNSGELYPDDSLAESQKKEIIQTIQNIDLNNTFWKSLRVQYYKHYLESEATESQEEREKFLSENAPIILAELKRPIRKIIIEED